MSCMREASPPLPDDNRHDIKKRRFLQPLRGLRRIFRRKGRPVISTASDGNVDAVSTLRCGNDQYYETRRGGGGDVEASNLEPSKSHSTSQLIEDQIDNSHRRSLQSTLLSVSHDSVFTSEQRSADSGSETSLCVHHTRLGFPHSSVRAELFEAVRRRRGVQENNNVSDDEDLGLPRSPDSNSPTAADDMFTKENIVTKSSQSTCSDGSLLSMGSSDIDEESYCQSSRHSSKLSLHEKRTSTGSDIRYIDRSTSSSFNDSDGSFLSHSAAKHKMAVKPKRNHGAPHKKRQLISNNTLPTTPELNEENGSKSVAVPSSCAAVADTRHSDEHQSNPNVGKRTTVARVDAVDHHHHQQCAVVDNVTRAARAAAAKSSSLPPNSSKSGVSPATSFRQLGRSGSNAASPNDRRHVDDDAAAAFDEKNAPPVGKRADGGASFFSRLLLRRSSKKKKTANEDAEPSREDAAVDEPEQSAASSLSYIEEEEEQRRQQRESIASYVNGGLNAAMKHHPMFRQRVEPLNLPTKAAAAAVEPPTYASNVPVNMDAGRVCKSFSFRSDDADGVDKLPLTSGGEEATSSVSANVESTTDDRDTSSARSSSRSNEYEPPPAAEQRESGRSKTSTSVRPSTPESGNASPLNTLNINVNEQAETRVDGEEECETKSKLQQTSEVKIPVPAPRISLLGRTSSVDQLNEIVDDAEKMAFGNTSVVVAAPECEIVDEPASLNVTVTEIDDGQKSIISISSRPSVASDADPFETTAPPARPESVVAFNSSSDGEYADDVFLPLHESTRFNPTDASGGESMYETAASLSSRSTASANAKADPTVHSRLPSLPSLPEPVSKPPVLPTKPERIRPRPSGGGQKAEKPLAVVVSDPQTGTMKVNDAVVVMRKKSRPERDSCPPAKSKDDDEPELMKVFARRSLKLKESDSVEDMLLEVAKSRDSDKENEDWNTAPSPDRTTKRKDEPPDPTPKLPFAKFQRSTSHEAVLSSAASNENEKRQRCKSTPNEREPESDVETKSEAENVTVEERTTSTPFKRIQQRREEWEKRAQQAMKVYGAK